MVREAKEKDLVREGKMLQKDYLSNRKRFWQKVKGEGRAPKMNASIEAKDGKVLTGKEPLTFLLALCHHKEGGESTSVNCFRMKRGTVEERPRGMQGVMS